MVLVLVRVRAAQSCPTLQPSQDTGLGSLPFQCPFQIREPSRIFPTQGSNPGLPHCRWILYQLSHKGSLKVRIILPSFCTKKIFSCPSFLHDGELIIYVKYTKWHPTPLFLPGKFQEQRAFRATVHAAVKSQTQLRLAQWSTTCMWNMCWYTHLYGYTCIGCFVH